VSASATIRVLLAEDHTIVRQGLRALLGSCDDIEVVGEAEDGAQALSLARKLDPSVVVMDIGMPGLNGIDTTQQLRAELPNTQVVILSMHSGEEYVRPVIRAGARAYLLKGSDLSDLVTAIRAVHAGEAFFGPTVASLLLEPPKPRPAHASLTPRELEVVQRVAEGRSSPEIARELSLSVKTVEGHRSRIMAKLGVANVASLVRYAVEHGILDADDA